MERRRRARQVADEDTQEVQVDRAVLRSRATTRGVFQQYNFAGGPGALPEGVLEQTQGAIRRVPGQNGGILAVSHRSPWFRRVVEEAETNIRELLCLPSGYHVLFLASGSSLQFPMVPMTVLRDSKRPAEYVASGYWSNKAVVEARREGRVRVLWNGRQEAFRRLPGPDELTHSRDAAYLHYVSNESVEGLQFHRLLGPKDVPRVCDMSSDFLSRPFDVKAFALIYAHTRNNLGPAGVTVAIVRDDVLAHIPSNMPGMRDSQDPAHLRAVYNTAPVLATYTTMLVTRWLRDQVGGLAEMEVSNRAKAAELYRTIDTSDGFYRGHAAPENRSLMNVVFRLPSRHLEQLFLSEAESAGFHGLTGHRSVGGIRASIYNAVTLDAVIALCDFMEFFRARHGDEGDS